MAQPGGKLVLHVEEAILKRDTETFGTMDPYCKIVYAGNNHKTPVKEDAGKTPKWHHRMELDVEDVMDKITFNVYNSNMMSDEQIAHTTDLKIYNLIGPNNGMTEDHHLFFEQKDRGIIKIRT
jgi:Ca2+-dependent lipid-binding protein